MVLNHVANRFNFDLTSFKTLAGQCDMVNGEQYSGSNKRDADVTLVAAQQPTSSPISTSLIWVFHTTVDGKIIFSNHSFREVFKKQDDTDEFIGDLMINPEDFLYLIKNLSQQNSFSKEAILFTTTSGDERTALVDCQMVSSEDQGNYLSWTALDVTRQIDVEKQLVDHKNYLAKVNMQLERFLYSTSHELRSPITSILGLINVLSMETKDPVVLDYVSKISQTTLKLDRVIHDITNFAKTRNEKVTVSKIEVKSLVSSIVRKHSESEHFSEIDFEINVDDNLVVHSDILKLTAICESLVANSIDFSDKQKAHSFIRITAFEKNGSFHFEIHDNGMGVHKQYVDKLFTMFFKPSAYSGGAGLGLYIVKQAIDQLEGRIGLESELGFGTVIQFSIPNHSSSSTAA